MFKLFKKKPTAYYYILRDWGYWQRVSKLLYDTWTGCKQETSKPLKKRELYIDK